MTGQGYSAGAVNGGPRWPLLFAKEPEPDLNVELDEPGAAHHQPSPFGSPTPQKPPRLRMLILILFLLIVAGATYVAMDPDMVMKLIGQKQSVPARPAPGLEWRQAQQRRTTAPIRDERGWGWVS